MSRAVQHSSWRNTHAHHPQHALLLACVWGGSRSSPLTHPSTPPPPPAQSMGMGAAAASLHRHADLLLADPPPGVACVGEEGGGSGAAPAVCASVAGEATVRGGAVEWRSADGNERATATSTATIAAVAVAALVVAAAAAAASLSLSPSLSLAAAAAAAAEAPDAAGCFLSPESSLAAAFVAERARVAPGCCDDQLACPRCTYANSDLLMQCELCGVDLRPHTAVYS